MKWRIQRDVLCSIRCFYKLENLVERGCHVTTPNHSREKHENCGAKGYVFDCRVRLGWRFGVFLADWGTQNVKEPATSRVPECNTLREVN